MSDVFGETQLSPHLRERLEELVASPRRAREAPRPVAVEDLPVVDLTEQDPSGQGLSSAGDEPDDQPTQIFYPEPDWLADIASSRRRSTGPSSPDDARRLASERAGREESTGLIDRLQQRWSVPATDQVDDQRAGDRRQFTRTHLLVLIAAVCAAVGVFGFAAWSARPVPIAADDVAAAEVGVPVTGAADEAPADSPATGEETPAATDREPELLTVHVLGDVASPGVVELPTGSRVHDALQAAGGLTEEADPAELNLAQPLGDGQQIIVGDSSSPAGEVRGAGAAGEAGGDGAAAGQKVNLNTTNAAGLESLPGVGPKTAERILAWREDQGPFARIEDLQEVSGIGPKTFAELAPLVTV